jgi:uncharacterized protein YecT (DUF1311 family)
LPRLRPSTGSSYTVSVILQRAFRLSHHLRDSLKDLQTAAQQGNYKLIQPDATAAIMEAEPFENTDRPKRRTYAASALMTICALLLSWQSSRSEEQDPHEITALGVISENVREIYAREVEICYNEAGKVARGPQFLSCLQRQVRSQQDALDALYSARISYLRYSPELAASLQNAQEAWLHFREANCGFVRSSARANYADEAFQNCLLRTTIYRRVNLRWQIGD